MSWTRNIFVIFVTSGKFVKTKGIIYEHIVWTILTFKLHAKPFM